MEKTALTKKEQSEKRRLDRKWLSGKATHAEISRARSLQRKAESFYSI